MKKTISFVMVLVIALLLCSCTGKSGGIGSAGISADEFDQLWLNMTEEKVNGIIGGKGDLISESKSENDEYFIYITLYRYEGEISGYAELEFTQKVAKGLLKGGSENFTRRLSSKTNYDLE